ncbi:DMT family transporter [Phenylobacterium sp. VNQ135]|uniref:DMT family transporter n=1 Tax=Phenylobacterium sp. VNQ135 TaxID=3400922 RepID=UPI003C105718
MWRAAPLLLSLTILFWAGNSIAGRALAGLVPPVALSFWRWLLALVLVTPLAWPHLRRDLPVLRARWRIVVALALMGVASFGVLLYFGLHTTTALNSVVMQAGIPPLVMLFGWLGLKDRVNRWQVAGMALSLTGVLAVVTRGRPWDLMHLGLNAGDGLILIGVVLYAVYSLMLRRRPDVHPLSLLWATFAVSALALAPLYAVEMALGARMVLSAKALLGIAYVAALPSFAAYLFFNRGVELVGAARASQYMHLQPIFGAVLAVLLLGERFQLHHALGMALILVGIVVSGRKPRC